MGERRGVYRVLVGRRRWEEIIKMEVRWGVGGMDWIELAQDSDRWHALVNMLMNLWVPYNARNFFTN